MLDAAFHEVFQHVVLREEGITNGKQQHRKGGGSDSGVIKPRPIGFSSDIKGSPQGPLFPQEVFIEQFEALKQPSGLYFIQQMIQFQNNRSERIKFTPKGKSKCGC